MKKFAIMQGISYSFVDTKDKAVEVRASMRSQTTGIIVLTTPFARGYDLKLTVDAKVYIVANGNKLKQSDVFQMLGRGCRSQGNPDGILILCHDLATTTQTAYEKIMTRQVTQSTAGFDNLLLLRNFVDEIKKEDAKKFKAVFEGDKWKIN